MYVFRGIKVIIYKTTLINTLIIRKTLFIDRVFISFIITLLIFILQISFYIIYIRLF